MKDPEIYLRQIGVSLDCPVHHGRRAILDAAHRLWINHEAYFFSSRRALEEFRKEPLRYCGELTDPVSMKRFRPNADSPHHDYAGRPYFFESAATLAVFAADAAMYAEPKRSMPPP